MQNTNQNKGPINDTQDTKKKSERPMEINVMQMIKATKKKD
jgi:hypothetical protein